MGFGDVADEDRNALKRGERDQDADQDMEQGNGELSKPIY
jgi:hypothetical protein